MINADGNHEYDDGLHPHQCGYAILASGSIAYVQPNGDVSRIETEDDYVDDFGPLDSYRWNA